MTGTLDKLRPQVTNFGDCSQNWDLIKARFDPKSVGTVFPTQALVDGQEFIYKADVATGVYWRFIYDSAQATFKWVFSGGSPLTNEVVTSGNTASVTYAALATAGPLLTVPFAGDYDVEISARTSGTVANVASMSYDIGATAAVDADAAQMNHPATLAAIWFIRQRRKTSLAAGTVLTAKYKTSANSSNFDIRRMNILPIRISG